MSIVVISLIAPLYPGSVVLQILTTVRNKMDNWDQLRHPPFFWRMPDIFTTGDTSSACW